MDILILTCYNHFIFVYDYLELVMNVKKFSRILCEIPMYVTSACCNSLKCDQLLQRSQNDVICN